MKLLNARLTLLAAPALLGCSRLLVEALTLAAVCVLVLLMSGLLLALLRRHVPATAQVLTALLIAGTLLTCASLVLQMHNHELSSAIELFLPLLALPCAGLAHSSDSSALSGLRPGLGIASLAILLGTLREALGQGTLLQHAHWLFGAQAYDWPLALTGFNGAPLLAVAAGGLILLGALLALARLLLPATHDHP